MFTKLIRKPLFGKKYTNPILKKYGLEWNNILDALSIYYESFVNIYNELGIMFQIQFIFISYINIYVSFQFFSKYKLAIR